MEKILGSVTISPIIIEDVDTQLHNSVDFEKKVGEYTKRDTTDLLGLILYSAIHLEASDVHIEPQQERIRLRIRLDGILHDITFFEEEVYQHLLSRLKLLARLKLNIKEKPQDGRFTITVGETLIEVRLSTLPSEWGESIVMRILNPKNLMTLENLGLRQDVYDLLVRESNKPNGMIALAGPTGSGKTTTLYALLMKIYNPGIKVITIEDPIEYHLTGISQTQVNPDEGYTFAEGLSSIVRQDPDVILIGEIRDAETAKIAIQSALTGHLVLSTIHTNDVAGIVPRLNDFGVTTPSITSASRVIISQRLIRKACKFCLEPIDIPAEILAKIKSELTAIPQTNLDEASKQHIREFLENPRPQIVKNQGASCSQCNFTGYHGRKGIFEIWVMDSEMEKYLLTNPPVSAIREHLIQQGMITMYQSGLLEVITRETTLEEIERVTDPDM